MADASATDQHGRTTKTTSDNLACLKEDPPDFTTIRGRTVSDVDNSFTRGERRFAAFFGREADFIDHMNEIRSEFLGKSELLFVHAALVIALRRKIDVEHNFRSFEALWSTQGEFLRAHLSLRWLISACDTMADYASSPVQRAISMISVILVNTVKLHETEWHVHGLRDKQLPIVAAPSGFLFDGITCFSISEGDMVKNMLQRAASLAHQDAVSGPILMEVLRRLNEHPTVFRRFENLRKAADINPEAYPKIVRRKKPRAKPA